MDPLQLELMQEMVEGGNLPGVMPGRFGLPGNSGIANLSMMADPRNLSSPYGSLNRGIPQGNPTPDISPLAPLQLQQYGIGGAIAGLFGNAYLTSALESQGIMPIGNAGSYMQAARARQQLKSRQIVSSQIAPQDAAGIYRTIRGGAALAGIPFNEEQREGARGFAKTISEFGPILATVAPDFMDAISGEKGSIQVLANQVMEANRYRMDPATGRMGYSAGSNSEMIKEIFGTMFSQDNMARMQGLRAGDVGQLYRELSAEGLANPVGSTRERTIQALQKARESGVNLTELGNKAGVQIGADTNLQSLSDAALTELRKNESVQSRMTKSDTRQVTDRLQSYVGSLAAMREVFGENGDLNAPMPKLINALRALTSGQMQAFDSTRLNTMVRDVQAMSQTSGKSIDQIVAMNQLAHQSNAMALGPTYGRYGTQFDHTSTKLGVAAGMSVAQLGGAVGFGALNRQQIEQVTQQQYAASLNSEMFNALGAVTRLEQSGGFADNDAGREMKAALAAIDNGAENYTFVDKNGKTVTKQVPTREAEFRSFISRGAVANVNSSDFNQMLSNRTANLRAMSETPERQGAVQAQQANEVNRRIESHLANLYSGSEVLSKVQDPNQRRELGNILGQVANETFDSLTMDQLQDPQQRNQIVAQSIKTAAANKGITLSNEEATRLAVSGHGTREEAIQRYHGTDATGYALTNSKRVREHMREQQSNVAIQAKVNQAMSSLGPKGSLLQRAMSALQKQGDRGEGANINTLIGDLFGAGSDLAAERLSPIMLKIRDQEQAIQDKRAKLSTASPAEKVQIRAELDKDVAELAKNVAAAREIGDKAGITDIEGVFNLDDARKADRAGRELNQLTNNYQLKNLVANREVTKEELAEAQDTKITSKDHQEIAVAMRELALREEEKKADDVKNLPPDLQKDYNDMVSKEKGKGYTEDYAKNQIRKKLRERVRSVSDIASELEKKNPDMKVKDYKDEEIQKIIVKGRRQTAEIIPTGDELAQHKEKMRKVLGAQPQLTQENRNKLNDEERKAYTEKENELAVQAESNLTAERQLKLIGYLGEKDSLLASKDDISKMSKLDPELRKDLMESKIEDRHKVVLKHLEKLQLEQYYGKDKTEVEIKRRTSRHKLETEEGKKAVQDINTNLQSLAESRREFLYDPAAVARGGASGLAAVEKSQKAEKDLALLARKYFGSSESAMLYTGAMSAEGAATADAEFAKLSQEKKVEVANRLQAAGSGKKDPAKLTSDDYRAYISLQAKDTLSAMQDSRQELSKFAEVKPGAPAAKPMTPAEQARLKSLREQDIGILSSDVLADAFGMKTVDDREKFKQQINKPGYTNKVNLNMVAGVIKQVEKLNIGDKDATGFKKLDDLTDEFYKAKTEEDRKKVASKYNLNFADLNRMMEQTEFLGLRNNKETFTKEQLSDSLRKVEGRNIAEEVKADEARTIRITGGTINFVGDVHGKGTFSEVTAVGGR